MRLRLRGFVTELSSETMIVVAIAKYKLILAFSD
jgi:hypothetical protein